MNYLRVIVRRITIIMIIGVISASAWAQNYRGLQHNELAQDTIKAAIVGSVLDAIIPVCSDAFLPASLPPDSLPAPRRNVYNEKLFSSLKK